MPRPRREQLEAFDRADMESKLRDRVDEADQLAGIARVEKLEMKAERDEAKQAKKEAKDELKLMDDELGNTIIALRNAEDEIITLRDIIESQSNCPPVIPVIP